ncbi:MAG: DUF1178 domain-containing protein [Deltaproteobacteria bacterium HGW-Deltaproteobacteria-10]|nr:MAG: DUF1178 domain-containing protein [Deltaproteobacteria bacterium HGW-Deltaproteobacteria-10]
MIIFDLKCEKGHKFDGWFKDRQTFIEQNSQKLVACPICNNSNVAIVPSSVAFVGKDSHSAGKIEEKDNSPLKVLQAFHQYIDKNFEDVGNQFAEVALKIHFGEEEKRNIKGTTTPNEEANLREEGVQFIKIPAPKMDS